MRKPAALARFGKSDSSQLPDEVYASLVNMLYLPPTSMLMGAIGCSACALVVAWAVEMPVVTESAAALALMSAVRIGLLLAYVRASKTPFTRADVTFWERAYAVGAGLFAGLLGLFSYIAISASSDAGVQLIVAATAIGYASGIAGRNAGRTHVVHWQVLLCNLPLGVAFTLQASPIYGIAAFLLFLNALSLFGTGGSIRGVLYKALFVARENVELASSLSRQNGLFDSALNGMSHGLAMVDGEHRLSVCNSQFKAMFDLPAAAVEPGTHVTELMRGCKMIETASGAPRLVDTIFAHLGALSTHTISVAFTDGKVFELTFEPMADGGCVVISEDITERRAAEERVEFMARFDPLTSLPNRTSFSDALQVRLANPRDRFAVLSLDLDKFKEINDTLGHGIGDKLLVRVAERLKSSIRDIDMVARFGGDEFLIMLGDMRSASYPSQAAQGLIDRIRETFDIDGQLMDIGASIGVVLVPQHARTVSDILAHADMALYAAKNAGRNQFALFDPSMQDEALKRRKIEKALRAALASDDGQLEVHYQPLVDFRTGRVTCCEALLRWRDPELGPVSPVDFIPIAEESGLIVSLGEWALRTACREAMNWPSDVRVAVNLSPVQFRVRGLIDTVRMTLAETGLPPRRLELEVTESVLIQDSEAVLATVKTLKAMDIKISLDDFGTGFSSLSYIRHFPFDKIKIDRSFTKDSSDPTCLEIIRAVTSMSVALGKSVVVEGVETESQRDALAALGCSEGQGWLFSKPAPGPEVRAKFEVSFLEPLAA